MSRGELIHDLANLDLLLKLLLLNCRNILLNLIDYRVILEN